MCIYITSKQDNIDWMLVLERLPYVVFEKKKTRFLYVIISIK